jgi:hypothetical protein
LNQEIESLLLADLYEKHRQQINAWWLTLFDPAYRPTDRHSTRHCLPESIERGQRNEERQFPAELGKANQIQHGTDTLGLGVLVGTAPDFSDSIGVGDLESQVGVPAGVCDVRWIDGRGTCLGDNGHLVAPGPQQTKALRPIKEVDLPIIL